jgi:hypothetical protein
VNTYIYLVAYRNRHFAPQLAVSRIVGRCERWDSDVTSGSLINEACANVTILSQFLDGEIRPRLVAGVESKPRKGEAPATKFDCC